jgi:DNA-binding CsgD family transcriptional regulator
MLVTEKPSPFVGRRAELAALRAELRTACSGIPRVVLVEGNTGIGKTVLIEQLLDGESNVTVLRATGEPLEACVANGVIDQLVRAAGVDPARVLPDRAGAFPVEEAIGVGARLLEVLGDLEQKAPVAVVVDDAQWADRDSLRSLLFAVRRLGEKRVLTVLSRRAEGPQPLPDGLRRLAAGRSGSTVTLEAMPAADIRRLAHALGVHDFSVCSAQRLQAHTEGNALLVTTMLAELPEQRWQTGALPLLAPGAFAAEVQCKLAACSPWTRELVEAVSVLGTSAPLLAAAALADVPDLVAALDEASAVALLRVSDDIGVRTVSFPHALLRAAVYGQLGPSRLVRLHTAAAAIAEDEEALLRHRVLAATPADPELATELDDFARREAARGAWPTAAWALAEASSLSADRSERERRLLRAADATITSGDFIRAEAFTREVASTDQGAHRDATLGYLAMMRGNRSEAENLLHNAFLRSGRGADGSVTAVVAQRLALHNVGRLRGADVVEWIRRAAALPAEYQAMGVEAEAFLGVGLGWQGRLADGLAACEARLVRTFDTDRCPRLNGIRTAHGWLRLIGDDVTGARATLAATASTASRSGSTWTAAWSLTWLAHANFAAGAWTEAAAAAGKAVSLLDATGQDWLRPLARYTATLVPAARGEWAVAEEHVRASESVCGGYELMVVTSGMAGAALAAARNDHEGVLRALEPVAAIEPRACVDEPGWWPWQDLYADALVCAGRIDEADAFLIPHEELSAARGRSSMIARLARVRGRIDAACGRMDRAEWAFERALAQIELVAMPFQQALIELAYGQALRRGRRRRIAAARLRSALDRFAELGAVPYLERCERELRGCGLAPGKRSDFDPARLTPQEQAVARLVAAGMSNRQVASELFVSVKTVQFHVTHIYAKLGIGSRGELAARFREGTSGMTEQVAPPAR